MKWNDRTFEEKVEYFEEQIKSWKNRTKGYEVKDFAEYIAKDLEYALTSEGEDDDERETFELDGWDLEDYEQKFLKENYKYQLWTKGNGDEFLISVFRDKNEAIKEAWELYDNRCDESAEIRVYANDTDYDLVQYRLDIEANYHSKSKGYQAQRILCLLRQGGTCTQDKRKSHIGQTEFFGISLETAKQRSLCHAD